MEKDYLGYLLKALEAHEQRDLEAYLSAHPEAQGRLEALQQTLEPLSWDPPEAPAPDLAARTVALVMPLHVAGSSTAGESALRGLRPGRHMVQVVVAVVMALVAGGLIAVFVGRLRQQQTNGQLNPVHVVECKNNLQKLYTALRIYSDTHGRQFPNVANAAEPPRNVGGLVYPILHDAKLLSADTSVRCPGAIGLGVSPYGLEEVKAMQREPFECWANHLHHSYAYSLGYKGSKGQTLGLRLEDDKSALLPLMADSAPLDASVGNSPHHGGHGQNVLYCDGHVSFCTVRTAGYDLDDIYLNRLRKVAAGLDWTDTVLSSSLATP